MYYNEIKKMALEIIGIINKYDKKYGKGVKKTLEKIIYIIENQNEFYPNVDRKIYDTSKNCLFPPRGGFGEYYIKIEDKEKFLEINDELNKLKRKISNLIIKNFTEKLKDL